jgi:hypothetical protein
MTSAVKLLCSPNNWGQQPLPVQPSQQYGQPSSNQAFKQQLNQQQQQQKLNQQQQQQQQQQKLKQQQQQGGVNVQSSKRSGGSVRIGSSSAAPSKPSNKAGPGVSKNGGRVVKDGSNTSRGGSALLGEGLCTSARARARVGQNHTYIHLYGVSTILNLC